jgi:hypothetical protein
VTGKEVLDFCQKNLRKLMELNNEVRHMLSISTRLGNLEQNSPKFTKNTTQLAGRRPCKVLNFEFDQVSDATPDKKLIPLLALQEMPSFVSYEIEPGDMES